MPDGQLIEFAHLTKRFGAVTAVSGLSARVEPGLVTGFLGPNGAGKTTTLRMLLGQVQPTSGTATIGGVSHAELKSPLRTVGSVLEQVSYRPRRTAARQLTLAAKANGISLSRIDEVLAMVGMQDDADTRIGTYSLGMRQRLSIAVALLGNPGTLVLDEPANGLDPEGIRWVRLLMRRLADEGKTVLVSSHVLSEIEQTADQVLVLSKGRLVFAGEISKLADPSAGPVVVDAEDRSALAAALTASGLEHDVLRSGLTVRGSDAGAVGAVAAAAGVALTTLVQRGPTLEDVFLDLTHGRRDMIVGAAAIDEVGAVTAPDMVESASDADVTETTSDTEVPTADTDAQVPMTDAQIPDADPQIPAADGVADAPILAAPVTAATALFGGLSSTEEEEAAESAGAEADDADAQGAEDAGIEADDVTGTSEASDTAASEAYDNTDTAASEASASGEAGDNHGGATPFGATKSESAAEAERGDGESFENPGPSIEKSAKPLPFATEAVTVPPAFRAPSFDDLLVGTPSSTASDLDPVESAASVGDAAQEPDADTDADDDADDETDEAVGIEVFSTLTAEETGLIGTVPGAEELPEDTSEEDAVTDEQLPAGRLFPDGGQSAGVSTMIAAAARAYFEDEPPAYGTREGHAREDDAREDDAPETDTQDDEAPAHWTISATGEVDEVADDSAADATEDEGRQD